MSDFTLQDCTLNLNLTQWQLQLAFELILLYNPLFLNNVYSMSLMHKFHVTCRSNLQDSTCSKNCAQEHCRWKAALSQTRRLHSKFSHMHQIRTVMISHVNTLLSCLLGLSAGDILIFKEGDSVVRCI